MILGKWPTWRTILFYVFISILYMFRATSCSSSGESIVSIQHLVYVTVCRWPFRLQVTDTEWHIPDVVLIQLILLMMMSTRLLETCRELKKIHRKELCVNSVIYQRNSNNCWNVWRFPCLQCFWRKQHLWNVGKYLLVNTAKHPRGIFFYIWVSVHHKSIIYNKPTRCNSGSIVFINNYKYALHVSDVLCVYHQEHYKL